MREWVKRTTIVGLPIAIAIALGACQNATPNEPCNDGFCAEGTRCELSTIGHQTRMRCVMPDVCGNGVPEPENDEVCDDGNRIDGDGCSADCRSDETCGNGVIDTAKGEVCDDGNTMSGDGCSADCRSNETCGNGAIDKAKGEVCDDGNAMSGDGCSADCRSNETCSNGITDTAKGEVCDDGNTMSGDGCSADCRSNETCGNGITDTAKGETCDPPEAGICTADCQRFFTCPDGKMDPGEPCDDGNNNDHDDCTNTCANAICGDHITHTMTNKGAKLESCDDGPDPSPNCPYGETSCQVCTSDCTWTDGTPHVCGDRTVDEPDEVCDDGNNEDCGSCDRECRTITSAPAVGFIFPAKGSEYQKIDDVFSGDNFVLDDGAGRHVTFEFAAGDETTVMKIGPDDNDSNADIAQKVVDAIGRTELMITAEIVNGSVVRLKHQRSSAFGNQPIENNVGTTNFAVVGMDGGEGGNCPAGTGCHDNDDCQPALACSDIDHTCH
jgi:cysteine-rich repeat protein